MPSGDLFQKYHDKAKLSFPFSWYPMHMIERKEYFDSIQIALNRSRGRRIGIECKRVDAPRITPFMSTTLQSLKLDQLYVVYPGPMAYPIAENISALPITHLASSNPASF